MVAERSVIPKINMVTYFEGIRIENIGMSSDKQCKNIVVLSLRFPKKG